MWGGVDYFKVVEAILISSYMRFLTLWEPSSRLDI